MFVINHTAILFLRPLVWATLMNTVQLHGISWESFPTLLWLLGATLALEIFGWALHGPARVIEMVNAFRIRANYRHYLLKGVLTMPLKWHTEHHSGHTIDRIEKGTTGLLQFSETFFEILYGVVQLIACYAMLSYFSPSAAFIVAGMVVLTGWITMCFDRILVAQYRTLNGIENDISERVFDSISNIGTIIILRVEKLVFETIMHKVREPLDLVRRNNKLNEWKWFCTSMCCTMMTILVLGTYFWQNIGDPKGVLVGSVYILIKYLDNLDDLFFKFTRMYGETVKRRARVENAEELTRDFTSESFTNHVLPPDWEELSIQGLTFSYDGTNPQLDAVDLLVRRGERIAFVGATGSGKTTMLKVMRGLYTPQHLELSVDDVRINDGFDGICRAVALAPQNPELFALTILLNLTLGGDYDFDDVRRCTNMACITEVIEALPRGFNSSIKEKGVNLSGGQQQRLALARALLACLGPEKSIILLDEPTSSLDAVTEDRVYRNIFKGLKGKTIISSVHRLHLLPHFDRICYFEGGRIVATGTLEKLLATCSQFRSLWDTSQSITT